MASTGIPGISFIPAGGLTTQTFDGLPGGMNMALPAQEIDDTEARYIQDALLDQPGLTRRRGPLTAVSGVGAAFTRKGTDLISALNPQGAFRVAALTGDASNGFLSVYDATLSSLVDLAWPHVLPAAPSASPYRISTARPALRGGSWIGVSSAYDASAPNQALGLWYGGTKATATVTVTSTRGSTSVTVSSTASLDVGMFIFSDTDDPYSQAYIGAIKSIDSGTTLTLTAPSPYTATAKTGGTVQALRGFAPKVAKGHLTTDTSSVTVTGGSTKFRSQKLDTGIVLSGTLTSGLATVTGLSSTASLVKGMPVTGTNVGVAARILSVDSGTQVTLSVNSTGSGAQSLTFKTPWDLYRASDGAFIGTVQSVQSETGLTLLANAAVAMADEAFVAVRADANFSLVTTGSTFKTGFITATYADRQWYFNNGADFAKTSRGWFSDTSDGEIVDMDDFAGDWIDVVSTSNVNEPIRGALAAYNGLCIFKENETFLVTGSSPSSFGVRKLEDDGVLGTGSIQPYAGGVIWAGREGIHLYDGINVINMTAAKLGDYWKNTIRTFDPTVYRMWSMIDRDHYFLFVENVSPTVAVVKGNTSTTPTKMTFVINLATQAVSTMVNVDIRGSVVLPASAGRSAWYLVNDSTKAVLLDSEALFNQEGIDSVVCTGSAAAGPDFYIESKKFDAGDGLRLKRFKQLAVWYLAQGDAMNVDVVLGLGTVGQTLTGNFPVSGLTWDTLRGQISTWDAVKAQFATWAQIVQSVFLPKRVRFQKKNQYMAFRLYQASSAVTRMQVGPFQLGFKLQRPGRI